jgi:hypothetical protein
VASSQEYAVISSPRFVCTVILVMRSFVVWGSVVVSGRGSPVASVVVHRCFGKVPSAGVSETVLFGGDGIAGRV